MDPGDDPAALTAMQLERALAAYSLGRYALAEAEARRLLARSPGHSDALCVLARALWRQGRVPEAVRAADDAVAQSPEYGYAWYVAGQMSEAAGELSAARARVARAVSLDPVVPLYHAASGYLAARAQDRAAALASLERALENGAHLPEVLAMVQPAYRRLGLADRARELALRWLSLRPADPVALVTASQALMATEPERAAELAREAVRRAPNDPDGWRAMLSACSASGDRQGFEQARQEWSRVLWAEKPPRILLRVFTETEWAFDRAAAWLSRRSGGANEP